MKKRLSILLIVVIEIIAIASCRKSDSAVSLDGKTVEMQYADLLTMHECDGYVYAQVRNPWDSASVLHSYILVDKDKPMPESLPEGDVVRVPVENAVVYTAVHCALLYEIGAYDCIGGVCDLKYIKLDRLQQDCKADKVKNLGEGTTPNIEGIIDLSPDAILLSPFQNSGTYGKVGKLGIPIIECADYMETSALGRAEWMRFYGYLTGHRAEADSVFSLVEKEYNDLKALAQSAKEYPKVITDLKFGSSWYVPGGNSTVGKLLKDAKVDYVFKDREESGSIPMNPETVFENAIDADVWIIKYNQAEDKSYDEIAAEYANYANIKAFKQHNIYACNTAYVPYYEETPFHPERLLKDYIKIFHPSLLKGYSLRFYKRTQQTHP